MTFLFLDIMFGNYNMKTNIKISKKQQQQRTYDRFQFIVKIVMQTSCGLMLD